MGVSYPFRFRREPEPDRPRLSIVDPAALVPDALCAVRAGSGDRIVVVAPATPLPRSRTRRAI